jgi:hypothetical protein
MAGLLPEPDDGLDIDALPNASNGLGIFIYNQYVFFSRASRLAM